MAFEAIGLPSGDFETDFISVVDYAVRRCRNEISPRKEFNMQPEPYSLDESVEYTIDEMLGHARRMISPGLNGWQSLYENLSDTQSKLIVLTVVAYRAIGWRYVQLPLNNAKFRACLSGISKSIDHNISLKINALGAPLDRINLRDFGFDLKMFTDPFGIFNEFIYSQYVYRGDSGCFGPEPGDTVIDCGACFGGTSIFFASCVGSAGVVYSFEFMEDNIDVFNLNVALNPAVRDRIKLIKAPVWSSSGEEMCVTGAGPGTQVSTKEVPGAGRVTSMSIDDLVACESLSKVNYIKMDVEGSEFAALSGAAQTIKTFKPRLAICVYHQLMDFYELPMMVKRWNPEYKLYMQHSSVHGDETVFFAV